MEFSANLRTKSWDIYKIQNALYKIQLLWSICLINPALKGGESLSTCVQIVEWLRYSTLYFFANTCCFSGFKYGETEQHSFGKQVNVEFRGVGSGGYVPCRTSLFDLSRRDELLWLDLWKEPILIAKVYKTCMLHVSGRWNKSYECEQKLWIILLLVIVSVSSSCTWKIFSCKEVAEF